MLQVRTKNGVKLYITFTDDCGENKGGYFCQVYLMMNMIVSLSTDLTTELSRNVVKIMPMR